MSKKEYESGYSSFPVDESSFKIVNKDGLLDNYELDCSNVTSFNVNALNTEQLKKDSVKFEYFRAYLNDDINSEIITNGLDLKPTQRVKKITFKPIKSGDKLPTLQFLISYSFKGGA